MILIISTVGATHKYLDLDMMKLSLWAFLRSLDRQTSKGFRLFLVGHNKPDGVRLDYPWLEWICASGDKGYNSTLHFMRYPKNASDPGEMMVSDYSIPLTDMSRKTYIATIEAGKWAVRNRLKEFWMLRMDSDDLLAKDMVRTLERMNPGIGGVYNRRCHLFDAQTKQIGAHAYPYSTTCNALRMKVRNEDEIDRWYYHCTDHTRFMFTLAKDGIKGLEVNNTLCILTNSGNSISKRPPIAKHDHTRIVPLTPTLIDRYGLEPFLEVPHE